MSEAVLIDDARMGWQDVVGVARQGAPLTLSACLCATTLLVSGHDFLSPHLDHYHHDR